MNINEKLVHFIRETYHIFDLPIPLHSPVFQGNENRMVADCIDSTFVSSVGAFVDEFENKIAEYTGAGNAIACVNGTSALHIALLVAGVQPGDEVITQPLSFVATANAIRYCNAHPVFVDVDSSTLGLSPDALENWLKSNTEHSTERKSKHTEFPACILNKTTGRKISAVVPMHTYGHPCRIDKIAEICQRFGLTLVEDAAESMGSTFKGKHTGTFGRVGVLSFNGNKIITSGGGGMILCNSDDLAKKAKHLTTQARTPHPWSCEHDEIGFNYRMPNLNAALGIAQLEQLPLMIDAKRKLSENYEAFCSHNSDEITFVKEPPNSRSNYWLSSVLFRNSTERDCFLEYAQKNGVMSRPAWKPLNELPMYSECQTDGLPQATDVSRRLVNLPSSAIL